MTDRRVRIGDISKALNVSSSTVSRALSDKGYVAAELKAEIIATAKRMGYVPDLAARSLRRGSSTHIGLVVTSLVDPFYAGLATGFQEVARAKGYEVILIIDQADRKEQMKAVESLLAMGVCALALTPNGVGPIRRVDEYKVPILQIDRSVSTQHSLVAGDNHHGGFTATRHLIEAGHRRIALMIDHDRWTTGRERIEGWRAAFEFAGAVVPEDLLFNLGDTPSEIAKRIESTLPKLAELGVTGIFAANSVVAQLLYSGLQIAGLRVPDDVSLVVYDNADWSHMVNPGVSAIDQHVMELGRNASEQLIRQVENGPDTAVVRSLVTPSLITRASVNSLRSSS